MPTIRQKIQNLLSALNTWTGNSDTDLTSAVQRVKDIPKQAATTITPAASSQTAVTAGKYTTGAITVAAVPTETPNTITDNGTYNASSDKWWTGVTVNVPVGSTINNQDITVTPSASSQYITADSEHTGLGTVTVDGDADLIGSNIKSGVNIFGVDGSYTGTTINNQYKSAYPSTEDQYISFDSGYTGLQTVKVWAMELQDKTVTANGSVTADSGYNGLGTVTVSVSGADTSDATATASDIIYNKTAYGSSGKITGTAKIPYKVEKVNGASYEFTLRSDGYFKSNNGKDDNSGTGIVNSCALSKVTFNMPSAGTLYVMYKHQGESNCDYGYFSTLDPSTAFNTSSTVDSSNIQLNLQNAPNTTPKILTYTVSTAGEHFFYVKYRKDVSLDTGLDSLQFAICPNPSMQYITVSQTAPTSSDGSDGDIWVVVN